MSFIQLIKQQFPLINIYIFNILPQGEEKNIYNFSYYASRKTRIAIAEKLNITLQKYSNINNVRFINIYSELIDKKGKRIKKYIHDDVHFNKKIMSNILNVIN